MTAKEKAKDLLDKFIRYTPAEEEYEYLFAKQCALIAVDEIIKLDLRRSPYCEISPLEYWQEVKQEIEKL